jgi:hydrogenase expression/formation protein HypD
MKFVTEFRDQRHAEPLLREIERLAAQVRATAQRPLRIMEVCGGHTYSIFRHGIEGLLPAAIELVHGPGCPVCVLPLGRIDAAIAIAEQPNVIFATFGDVVRVPGSNRSLLEAKARGADVRVVYSPLDALRLAQENPEREIVFFGLGFETTAPSTALTILEAESEGIRNFTVFCNQVTIIPAIKAILDSPDMRLDGFLGPGHVSMVIGTKPYAFVARHYRKPLVISGFEPLDILQSIWMVLRQLDDGRCEIENQYGRVAANEGNRAALTALTRVFEVRPYFEWRGLGSIDHSGLRLRPAYAGFDAEQRFAVANLKIADPKSCQCGEVLKGVLKPWECKVFGTACTPETPIGACMVSSEGACAAYYNFGRLSMAAHASSGREAGATK